MKLAKKIVLGVAGILMVACSNDYKGIFDKAPDERIGELTEKYKEILLDSEHGWMGHYYSYPGKLGAYTMVFKFDKNGTYDMNWSVRDEMDNGSYTIKSIEKPLISFDTYSNFTKFADPALSMDGEVEFSFIGVSENRDTLFLEERIKQSPFTLVRAKASDWQDIHLYNAQRNFLIREIETEVRPFYYNLEVEGWDSKMTLVYYDNRNFVKLFRMNKGKSENVQMGINLTKDGFELMTPVGMNGIYVRSFVYDPVKGVHRVAGNTIKGEFSYEEKGDFTIDGAAKRYFGKGKFGTNSQFESVNSHNKFDDLTPLKFETFQYSAYGSIFSEMYFTFSSENKSGRITGVDPIYEIIGENQIKMSCSRLSASGDLTQEEVDACMLTEKGKEFQKIFFSEKGWTVIPIYEDEKNEYLKNIYLVSNEDPTIYFTFGEIAEEEPEE